MLVRAVSMGAALAFGSMIAPQVLAQSPLAGPATPARAPDRRLVAAKMDEYLKAAVLHDQFSGSVLVARDGVPLFDKGYGLASYELNVPNTPQTVFNIASLTKQFTAMAIMQLQEQKKLVVGDPICRYLDDCPAAWQPITIRHLLTHSSGIPNYSSLPRWDEDLGLKKYRRDELVDLFRNLPLQSIPGEKYKYSNSGYFLLGLIIERASGQTYGKFLRERIFMPLNMKNSAFDNSRALVLGRATGYYSRGTSFVTAPYVDPSTTYADGGITSTTADLLRWDQALYTKKLVSRQSIDEMFTPYKGGYGFGWQIGERFGRQKIDHSGSLSGFSSYILRFPADRLTVIVLSNSDKTSAGKAAMNLAAIAFGASYEVPRPQLHNMLWDTIAQRGVEAAIERYHDLRRTHATKYDFGEETLLDLGYELIEDQRIPEAIAIFKLNVEMFPRSAYSYDGLADAAAEKGDQKAAVTYFAKSLSLDPANGYALDALARLRRK